MLARALTLTLTLTLALALALALTLTKQGDLTVFLVPKVGRREPARFGVGLGVGVG